MRKALVFVSAFALVLVAGVAFAFMSTSGAAEEVAAEDPAEIDKPATTEADKDAESGDEIPSKESESAATKVDHETKDEPVHQGEEMADPDEGVEADELEDEDPPDIVILHPEDGQHFEEKRIAFEGKTEPGAKVFAGKYEADVDGDGNFRIVLILQEGGNLATLKAVDDAGNEATASVKAYYDVPKETSDPGEDKPKEADEPKEEGFTAHQKFGSCGEDLPYDKWYGTGEPGTKIWVVSDFGEGSTTVGENGEWHLRVDFPESPCNDTFGVVLETDKGHRKVYEFTRLCEDDESGHEEEK